jgi:gliding motility associated protien GldN
MNLFLRYTLLVCFLCLGLTLEVIAQTGSTTVNSTAKKEKKWAKDLEYDFEDTIREEDKMYKISVWRRIDLREKINLPLYGSGVSKADGIMKYIYEAVMSQKVKAYSSDSLELSKEIGLPKFDSLFKYTDYKTPYLIRNLYYLDFKEDFVFDRHHSRFKFDIKYIVLVLPSEVNFDPTSTSSTPGLENRFAYIPYEELMKFFEEKNIKGEWINFNNVVESKTYIEAFQQRMFGSVVTKFTNPFDKSLNDFSVEKFAKLKQEEQNKLGPGWPKLQAFLDAMAFEYKLLDLENSFWEW